MLFTFHFYPLTPITMPSFLDQLAAEGDRTISRGKQVVKQAINEAKNVAYNAVKSAKEMGKETIKQLDAGCQHLASAIRNGVEKGWIKSISFLKSSGELIINGAKYAVNVAVGAGRYTLQL
ncbi:MAG: hypothetical protein LBG59_03710 [Candidatus Peribacteria bacterium]|nr:hypothetical protein [Candidatus Peribacteria bacterium]